MLTVSGNGKHSYQVKGVSKTNVDFEYFFVMIPAQEREMPIPITHPIIGKCHFRIFLAKYPVSLVLSLFPVSRATHAFTLSTTH